MKEKIRYMRAEEAENESKHFDFKSSFDIDSDGERCEIIKDIVAMANSGGGTIFIGIDDNGLPSGFDVSRVLNYDPAKLTDQIAKYTGENFNDFEIVEIDRNERKVAALKIGQISIPMIFIKPGTYNIGGGKQNTAFSRGTVYFRHGAKSEPGNSADLREAIERELERVRESWLSNVRKVIEAPIGYQVQIFPPDVTVSNVPTATPIRIVNDPNAPAFRNPNPDSTHPHRQKELLELINQRSGGKRKINQYDILCIRKVYKLEGEPQYYYKTKFSPPQYSDDFMNWLVKKYKENPLFFDKAREKCKDK